jgi:hypothetical protein
MVSIFYKYIILIIITLILFILFSHYLDYNRINNDLNIQQSEHPTLEVIDLMLKKRQPTLFRYELELWDGFDLLIGQSYEDIISVMKNNKVLEYNCQNIYLKPYALPLTKNWNIKCYKIHTLWNDLDNTPTRENKYMHIVACLSGMATICLISPKHHKQIEKLKNTKIDIKDEIIKENQWDYITIPIRPCNMIYIPFGWYYYLYNGVENNYCVLLDMKCNTYLD